jgi:diguanylate cyclase (GGDEF)-like protein
MASPGPDLSLQKSKQALRMRRFMLAAGAYAVCLPLLVASHYMGLIRFWPMVDIAVAMVTVNVLLFAAFRTGLNERFADPSLTWLQTVCAIVVLMVAVYHFDYDRGMALMVSLIVLAFGVFKFTVREFLRAAAVVLIGYGIVVNALFWFKADTVNVALEGFRWIALAGILPCFAIVCGRISEMRQRLRAANDELSLALDTIQKMATHDTLTALPNRTLFNESLGHALGLAERHRRGIALYYIDLDRFKYINESIGHSHGDRVLQEAARRISASVRSSDMVARLGGDEFVLLVEDYRDARDLVELAEKILASFRPEFVIEGQELALTASIGICTFPVDGRTVQALLSNADIAMYRAKEQGRNGYCFYAADLNTIAQERLAMEAGLRHALERDEFELYYQPKVDFRSGRLTGLEALIRWRHPHLGLMSPDRFIPLAEEIGVIVPMGLWTLRRACEGIRAWQERGIHAVPVAVNLSATQFHQSQFVIDLASILRATGVPAHMLELEITESMVMRDPERAMQVMRAVRKMGVRLAIDDFGTGHSSLGYLKRFPIDRLKIDRTFVRDIPHNADDVAITRAVIAMAHSLRMSVVAEGVEDAKQFELLRSEGCDEYQGYYCRPPLPEADLLRFMTEERARQRAPLRSIEVAAAS